MDIEVAWIGRVAIVAVGRIAIAATGTVAIAAFGAKFEFRGEMWSRTH